MNDDICFDRSLPHDCLTIPLQGEPNEMEYMLLNRTTVSVDFSRLPEKKDINKKKEHTI